MKWIFLLGLINLGAFANERGFLLALDMPKDVLNLLHDLDVVSIESLRQENHFRIFINSELPSEDLTQILEGKLHPSYLEPEQSGQLPTLDGAGLIDSRAIFVLDDIDSRAIFVLDDSQSEFEPMFGQPHTAQVRAEQAWEYTQGEGVVVAVLDTGVDLHHDFLVGNLVPGYDFVDMDEFPDDERSNLDSNQNGVLDEGWGHGTHVAGILKSIAPKVAIMPVRVADSDGQAHLSDIIEGISYAIDNGAQVINLSMSISEPSSLLTSWLEEARHANILVVTSAGNTNNGEIMFPATENEVVTVTSVDVNNLKTDFANYSRLVDVSAPGDWIISCLPGNRYVARSGTSMSTPMVAGQAALIFSLKPAASLHYVRQRISNKSLSIDNLNPDYRNLLGNGLIDVWDSITVQNQ